MGNDVFTVLVSGAGGVALGVVLAASLEEWRDCRRQRREHKRITAAVGAALVRNRARLESLEADFETENSPRTVDPHLLDVTALAKYGLLDDETCASIDIARDTLETVRRAMDQLQEQFALSVAQGTAGKDGAIGVRRKLSSSIRVKLVPEAVKACDEALSRIGSRS